MNAANFGPVADDEPVCGACRPGHLGADLEHWTGLLREHGVSTVVCLLSEGESRRWGLPDAYSEHFETAHLPIRDRHLPEPDRLAETLDALDRAAESGRVALHCNAGLGRTGVVGAAWLARQGYAPQAAVEAAESAPAPRAPREAIREGNATEADLYDLLSTV
ncbi:MAG: protein-tyrosine phosphatase [Natronomonas sp.]